MSILRVDAQDIERLGELMKKFPKDAENTINEVFHGEGATSIRESIRLVMPQSHKEWKGKGAPAVSGNSLQSVNSNLAVLTRSTKKYGYLYFPDDGTNTRRHVGKQYFFLKGAENVSDEIIDKCITKITNLFNEGE